ERAADRVEGAVGREIAQTPVDVGALASVRPEQRSGAHRRGPETVVPTECRGQRRAQLLRAERVDLEERQLPAVERLRELVIVLDDAELRQQLRRDAAAGAVETRRLAGRLRGCRR